MKYREAQTDFFGKRGISWHITVVTRKKRQQENESSIDVSENDQSDACSTSMEEGSTQSHDDRSDLADEIVTGKKSSDDLTGC